MRNKQPVTVYRLAQELHLSPGTISKALGNSPGISEGTRQRVRELAQSYGFRPRPFERQVSNICALIQSEESADSLFSSFVDTVLDGMWRYTQGTELEISLFSAPVEKLNQAQLVRKLHRMNIDGAVVITANEQSDYLRAFDRQHFPYCCVMSHRRPDAGWLLSIDNHDAAVRATRHLLDLGHRHLGVLDHAPQFHPVRARIEGIAAALRERGLPPAQLITPLAQGENGAAFGYHGLTRLLAQAPALTACLVLDQTIAVGALAALTDLGKRVPQDLSLLAFDDTPLASYLRPALSVIRMPNLELGQAAAEWVHQRIRGTAPEVYPPQPWMRGELILRQSTGPVPQPAGG